MSRPAAEEPEWGASSPFVPPVVGVDMAAADRPPTINRTVSAISPRTLADFDSVRLSDRVETKTVMDPTQAAAWLAEIAGELVILEHQGQRVQEYRNFYFDNSDLTFFRAHHNRRGSRSKVRFRSYGPTGPTAFEVKHKNHKGRSVKYRTMAESNQRDLGPQESELIADKIGVDPSTLRPVVAIGYRRILLANADLTERITVDLSLQCRSRQRHVSFAPAVIIEIKQDDLDRSSPAFAALRSVGARPGSFSKYCAGVATCVANVRMNRFKSVLRQTPPTDLYPNLFPERRVSRGLVSRTSPRGPAIEVA